MVLSTALFLLLGASPASAVPAPDCFLDYSGVVPSSEALDVPIDTLFRVQLQGLACSQDPLVVTFNEAGQDLAPIEVVLDVELGWISFPELELKANTAYSARFQHPDGQFITQFTTGSAMALPPVAPNVIVRDAYARNPVEGSPRARISAEVQAFTGDDSGNSTLIFFTPDGLELEYQSPNGRVDRSLSWIEETTPEEACVTAITVNPAGESSAPTEACAPVQVWAAESVDISASGCNCSSSSSGGVGWMLLGLIPALIIRRNRS
ncbi:MAG: MYXO-CTERM sorting domain-containing protein [Myxococcota bacterium]